jgi:hypothetical protein
LKDHRRPEQPDGAGQAQDRDGYDQQAPAGGRCLLADQEEGLPGRPAEEQHPCGDDQQGDRDERARKE